METRTKENNKIVVVLSRHPIIFIKCERKDTHKKESIINIIKMFKGCVVTFELEKGLECYFETYEMLYNFIYRLSCRFEVVIR